MRLLLALPLATLLVLSQYASAGEAAEKNGSAPLKISTTDSRYAFFLQSQIPTEEQRARILSTIWVDSGYSPSKMIQYQIQNSLSDYVITGFIAQVSYQDPATQKEASFDVFSNSDIIFPLSSSSGDLPLFNAGKIAKWNPKVEIKEFRIKKISVLK